MTIQDRPKVAGFEPSGFFALRTPLLPFDEFLRWTEGLSSTGVVDDEQKLEAALAADRDLQRRRLRDVVARPEVREALFLASPDLDDAIPRWLEAPESERGQRAERALIKYFSRMAGRATPFGLFAGTSAGRIGEATRLVLDGPHTSRRHSRLDTDFLFAAADAIARNPALREGLSLRPNSTLYESGGRLRYVEVRLDGKERTYHLVSVEAAPHHSETLARSAHGAKGAELAEALVDTETSPDEAAAYIEELVDAQLLVPDTGLVVTGPEPATAMAERLSENPATRGVSAALWEACHELDALDAAGIGNAPERYRSLAARLSALPARPELPRLFQVDLVKASPEAVVGKAVLHEIRRGVELLWQLGAGENSLLAAFRLAFVERYEEREIPLVEALDDESGIGFPPNPEDGTEGAPLLKGLAFPVVGGSISWGGRETFLLRKVSEAAARGETEIVLDDKDVDALAATEPRPLPGAFAAMVQVAAASNDALAKGRFQVLLEWAGGPSGARLLGRFCHWNAEFESLVQEHLRKEEELEPEAIFAEVVHLPDARAGNVLLRPLLRAYEIPFLGASGAPEDRQIPVTDLMVWVVGNEIRLRSRRLGRRIVPRMTTAHNYGSFGLGLYRFLCQLQGQGVASGLGWSWGPLAGAPFLPRVRHGRTILFRARWTVDREELEKLTKGRGAESFRAVAAWRKSRHLPRQVVLSDGDNGLPVDLESALSVEAFLHLVKRRGFIELTEMFPGPDELCACGPDGRYVHELLIPFVRTAESRPSVPEVGREAAAAPPSQPTTAPPRRSFPPGSEWLYAKLYAGAVTSEKVLLGDLAPLAREAVGTEAADRWFFVRYADPRHHLRIRVHGDPRRLREEVLPSLEQAVSPLLACGRVWRMQLDTYDREIERYGGAEGMDVAEAIFAVDTEAVVEILGMLEDGEAGNEERWRLALLGAEALLDDFGFSLGEKQRIVGTARKSLAEEQREGPLLKRALGERFRKESSDLERLFQRVESGGPLAPGIEAITARSRRLGPSCAALREMERDGRLLRPLADLAASFVHMHLNRLFRSAQRRQELVVYDFLSRLYASQRARTGAELDRDEQRTTGMRDHLPPSTR
jgi:lantibiotic biosynthesis protein